MDAVVWKVFPKYLDIPGEGKVFGYIYETLLQIPYEIKDEVMENILIQYQDKYYAKIGKTYLTEIKAKRGDILKVKVLEIKPIRSNGKLYWTWLFPVIIGHTPIEEEDFNPSKRY